MKPILDWISEHRMAMALGFASIVPATFTIRESLWIDELHSCWVGFGPWEELLERAASGNQSPLYFAFLKLFLTVLPSSEGSVRLPSTIAWGMAFVIASGVCLRTSREASERLGERMARRLLAMVGSFTFLWLLLDWVSWFYAIEARPYACGMFFLACMIASHPKSDRPDRQGSLDESRGGHMSGTNWLWSLWGSLAIWMQPTTGLVVLASWVGRLTSIAYEDRCESSSIYRRIGLFGSARIIEAILVGCLCSPLIPLMFALFADRKQWQGFAGNSSFHNFWSILPLVPWVLVPAIGTGSILKIRRDPFAIHLLAIAILPLFVCWLTTWMEWLPLMHRRYLLGAYLGMFLFGLYSMIQCRRSLQIIFVGLIAGVSLVAQQGTWRHWEEWEWMGWQRFEPWDEAVAILNERLTERDEIYLVPGLVETVSEPFPEAAHREYLKFPLNSLYRLKHRVKIEILGSDARQWSHHLKVPTKGHRWMVARVSRRVLLQWLQRSGHLPASNKRWEQMEHFDLANIQVVQLD